MSFTEHDRVTAIPFAGLMIFKVTHHRVERARQIDIVAINEAEYVAGRLLKALINRMDLTPIFFTDPEGEPIFIAPNDLYRFVGAAAVDDDVLEIGIILVEHRQNRLFQESALIK